MKNILITVLAILSLSVQAAPKPKVLLLGDSISLGYTPMVQKGMAEEAEVIRPAENCQGTTYGLKRIDAWIALEGGQWDVIHFNFGLHDLKVVNPKTGNNSNNPQHPLQAAPEQYRKNLDILMQKLVASKAQLIFALTTPYPPNAGPHSTLRDPKSVDIYNKIALELCAQYGIKINDLHAVVKDRLPELQQELNVHFTPAGSQVLADAVIKSIRESLKATQKPAQP